MKKIYPFIPLIGIFLVSYCESKNENLVKNNIVFTTSALFQALSVSFIIYILFIK